MNLELAQSFAKTLIANVEPRVLRIEVAGQIRRKEPEIDTVSFVIMPRKGEPFIEMGETVVIGTDGVGEKEKFYRIGDVLCRPVEGDFFKAGLQTVEDDIHIEIAMAREQSYSPVVMPCNFGSVLMLETGPDFFLARIQGRAKHLGYLWEPLSGLVKGCEIVAGATEKEIFQTLKMDYVEPEDRK